MFAFGACADCPHAGIILMTLVFAQAVIGARACEKASVDILCVKMTVSYTHLTLTTKLEV